MCNLIANQKLVVLNIHQMAIKLLLSMVIISQLFLDFTYFQDFIIKSNYIQKNS
jgi:hypothetical protein